MTTLSNLESFTESSKGAIAEAIYGNAWQMTSYLIQVLNKMEGYTSSLSEDNPDTDFYTANVAITSALELIGNTYNVPTTDERFGTVKELYRGTVIEFISNQSDDAVADLVYLSQIARFVGEMRRYAWSKVISETGPSEDKFKALKLAKRDEKVIDIALAAAADAIFGDD